MQALWLKLVQALVAGSLALLVALTFLRNRGLNQNFAAHPHKFWTAPITLVISPNAQTPLRKQVEDFAVSSSARILHLPLYVDEDSKIWVIPLPRARKLVRFQSGAVAKADLVNETHGVVLPLAEIIEMLPDHRLVLDLRSNVPNVDQLLIETIEQMKLNERAIVHSEFDVVLTNLRRQRPQWLFGIPLGERTRASLMASLFLEPIANFSGDVLFYFSPEKPENLRIISPRLIRELHRRHKKVLIGPTPDKEKQISTHSTDSIDGEVSYLHPNDAL